MDSPYKEFVEKARKLLNEPCSNNSTDAIAAIACAILALAEAIRESKRD